MKLRLAIDRAKAVNMPNLNIERAIKAGSGEDRGQMKEATYEGFGPGHVAIVVQAATDNPNRTSAELRSTFSKHGGALGSPNSVGWMFQAAGVIRIPRTAWPEEKSEALQLGLIDAGAEDVRPEGSEWVVVTAPANLNSVRDWLTGQGIAADHADVELLPSTTVSPTAEVRQQLYGLFEALEDHPDVDRIYANDA